MLSTMLKKSLVNNPMVSSSSIIIKSVLVSSSPIKYQYRYNSSNNNINNNIINNKSTTTSTTSTSNQLFKQSQSGQDQQHRNFLGHVSYKKQSPEYHRNSTLYAFSPREQLKKLEDEFVMPARHVPVTLSDKFARMCVFSLRKLSNLFFKEKYIHYACVLETVAAVPGLVAGMFNHLKTLRRMEHNNWIKILLDEAENERMHLMTFMHISMPTRMERMAIATVQALYWNAFLVFYVLSPKTAHRFTGYLEEEAVITYTNMLRDLDQGLIKNVDAPQIAKDYWGLPEDSKLRDVIIVIRQDEVDHGQVNHHISTKICVGQNDPVLFKDHDAPVQDPTLSSPKAINTSNPSAL